MTHPDWQTFFKIAAEVLGDGTPHASNSPSWCSWTTFTRLHEDACYWAAGVPAAQHIHARYIDECAWGQFFYYDQLAHVIIPRQFYWEVASEDYFESGVKVQDIEQLSSRLTRHGIDHRLGDLVLELKLY